MSHRTVETLLGRLATDPGFRRRFSGDRAALLEDLRSHGYALTAIELDALASTEPAAIDTFAKALDERLCKAEPINDEGESVMAMLAPLEPSLLQDRRFARPIDAVDVSGVCPDKFAKVRQALAANLASGADLGASAAVFIDGEPVVDIWGGYFDEARTRPWGRDTIVNTFSTTKTMTALCMLILADWGDIDLNAPVAKYWPEFAQAGKSGALVKHLLSHSAGLPGWDAPMTVTDLFDHERAASLLARQAPWWTPGTAVGYHPITFGPLIGEVIKRVTGQTLGQFFAAEVAGPLGADFHIGTGPECDARVTTMVQSNVPREPLGDGSISDRSFFNPYVLPGDSATIGWRRAELGGSNGHGNARSIAMAQSVLSNGGEARGVRLLSRRGAERALELQAEGTDLVAGYDLRWALGFALINPVLDKIYGNRLTNRRIAFWGGSGGSVVINDFDARMTVSFAMNRHVEHGGVDQRGADILCAAYDSL